MEEHEADVDYLFEDGGTGQLGIGDDGRAFRSHPQATQGPSLVGPTPRYGIGGTSVPARSGGLGQLPGGLPWAAEKLQSLGVPNDSNPSRGGTPNPNSRREVVAEQSKDGSFAPGRAFVTPEGQHLSDGEAYAYKQGLRKRPDGVWARPPRQKSIQEQIAEMEQQFLSPNDGSTAVDPTLIRSASLPDGGDGDIPQWLQDYMSQPSEAVDKLPSNQYRMEQTALRQMISDRR